MPQTNIKLKVLTRTVIKKFILHCEGQVRRLMFRVVIIRGLGNKTDSYNVSGVLIRERALVKEGDQDFAKRFLKATAQESLSKVNQTLQIQTKKMKGKKVLNTT